MLSSREYIKCFMIRVALVGGEGADWLIRTFLIPPFVKGRQGVL